MSNGTRDSGHSLFLLLSSILFLSRFAIPCSCLTESGGSPPSCPPRHRYPSSAIRTPRPHPSLAHHLSARHPNYRTGQPTS
eukprot:3575704-Rhodomonas_salina.2